ncbi:MAG: hypothetical protein EAZ97_10390 [Bacteroidetes bacterium]|nr:MAG: hypothetical protein EAZ97_10390 [Bacteroidota bacterium]
MEIINKLQHTMSNLQMLYPLYPFIFIIINYIVSFNKAFSKVEHILKATKPISKLFYIIFGILIWFASAVIAYKYYFKIEEQECALLNKRAWYGDHNFSVLFDYIPFITATLSSLFIFYRKESIFHFVSLLFGIFLIYYFGTNWCIDLLGGQNNFWWSQINFNKYGIGIFLIPSLIPTILYFILISFLLNIEKKSLYSVQCSGINNKGKRCRKRTTNKSGRCEYHAE